MKKIEFWFWLKSQPLILIGYTQTSFKVMFEQFCNGRKYTIGSTPFSLQFNNFLNSLGIEIDETDEDYINARFECMPIYMPPIK